MNLNLLQKHIDNFIDGFEVEKLSADGSNKDRFYCADVIGSKRFAQNYAGYPRNDIALINEQQNFRVAESMMIELSQLPVSDSNAGLTDEQILLGHRSKYIQTPAESVAFIEQQIQLRRSQREAESLKEQSIKFDESDDVVDKV